jgi:hypothetical protein
MSTAELGIGMLRFERLTDIADPRVSHSKLQYFLGGMGW